ALFERTPRRNASSLSCLTLSGPRASRRIATRSWGREIVPWAGEPALADRPCPCDGWEDDLGCFEVPAAAVVLLIADRWRRDLVLAARWELADSLGFVPVVSSAISESIL